jgi:hypothetical protein
MAEQSLTAPAARKPTVRPDAEAARGVILEILRQSLGQNGARPSRSQINHRFWLAHLYYARENRGFLTTWPILRASGGVEIWKVDGLLRDLVDDGLAEVEVIDVGPIPVCVYACTPAAAEGHLPDAAITAVSRAIADGKDVGSNSALGWPVTLSRAWRETPEGEEMNIYIDLIPDDAHETRRRSLEEMASGCKDLFK